MLKQNKTKQNKSFWFEALPTLNSNSDAVTIWLRLFSVKINQKSFEEVRKSDDNKRVETNSKGGTKL